MGKTLLVAGLLIAGAGALVTAGFPLGRLPGDLVYRRGSATIHLPITTSILLSAALSLVMMLVRR